MLLAPGGLISWTLWLVGRLRRMLLAEGVQLLLGMRLRLLMPSMDGVAPNPRCGGRPCWVRAGGVPDGVAMVPRRSPGCNTIALPFTEGPVLDRRRAQLFVAVLAATGVRQVGLDTHPAERSVAPSLRHM
jgi:hypothetical protein